MASWKLSASTEMSMSSPALSERVMRRDIDEWSMSTMATGTLRGRPSCIRLRKKNAPATGTITIMKR